MLGVTTHVSTDIAPVPLLWVLPLAIYLGTFVIVFSSRQWIADKWLTRLLPLLVYSCIITILMNARVWWLIPLHLATFFVAALLCHGELARRRPHPYHLTDFYIWMSLGGVLGGVFNSLLAPQLFNSIVEYPLVLAASSLASSLAAVTAASANRLASSLGSQASSSPWCSHSGPRAERPTSKSGHCYSPAPAACDLLHVRQPYRPLRRSWR